MQSRTLIGAFTAVLLLAGCGGGGGSSSSSGNPLDGSGDAGPSVSSKPASHVWSGTVTSPTTGTSSIVGLTSASGHGVWMSTDGRVWTGQMPMTGTQMNVSMAGYMYPGRQFADGSNYGMWSMAGSLVDGTWSGRLDGAGDHATFQWAMSPAYDRPASLELLAGTYMRTTSIGYTMTLSFSQGGQLTGSDSRGCVFNGSVSVPDPSHNLYQLHAVVTSCGILDGTYDGHGALFDATAMQSWMSSMGCFQYGSGGWTGGMMGGGSTGGGMMGGGAGRWWPDDGHNTVPSGTNNLFMFAITNGAHAIMDALAK